MGITDFFETDETVAPKKAKVVVKTDPNQSTVDANDLLKKTIINNKNWICGSLQ